MKYMRRTVGYTWTDYKANAQIAKELKNNTNFGQITGIQEKLDTTRKQNASKQITQGNEILLPNPETWTIKAGDARRITAAEMKYMRRTAGCTWTDCKTNEQIAKELKITPILDKSLE